MGKINYTRDDMMFEKIWDPNWYQKLAIRALCTGAIPKHITVIMDGNRRWAVERGQAIIQGHIAGTKTFDSVFHWMEPFGIRQISVFAFSPDNLKRDKNEVKELIELFETYLQIIVDKREESKQRGIRFMIYGNIDMLPSKLRVLAAKVMLTSWNNSILKVNMAIGYKASEEIDTVMETLKKAVADGDLLVEDIDEKLIAKCMYTGDGECPDLLIRTSGEKRFSDFYMWQMMRKPLFFCGGNWPDFTFTMFCKAILSFQRYYATTSKVEQKYDRNLMKEGQMMREEQKRAKDERVKKYLAKRERLYFEHLTNIVNGIE